MLPLGPLLISARVGSLEPQTPPSNAHSAQSLPSTNSSLAIALFLPYSTQGSLWGHTVAHTRTCLGTCGGTGCAPGLAAWPADSCCSFFQARVRLPRVSTGTWVRLAVTIGEHVDVWTNVRVGGDGTAPCVPVCQEAERGSWFPGTNRRAFKGPACGGGAE